MDELYEELLQACLSQDVVTIEAACILLGLNYLKILEYSSIDRDAQNCLKMCVGLCKVRVHEKFYLGQISKLDADFFVSELEDIELIYLNVPTEIVDENLGD